MRARIAAAALAFAALAAPAAPAYAHQGNPNFRSTVTSIEPPASGVEAEVVNLDDRLVFHSGGNEVQIEGYDGEPYLRFLADGTVEANTNSPAYYLNEDRFADAEVPASASADAEPEWKTVASGGSFEWHDHRIHWMAKTTPPQVTDEGERTKVFDWKVPIEVDGRPTSIQGELFWVPEESGFPVAAIAALIAVAIGAVVLVLFVRRRRDRGDRDGGEPKEAW